MFPESRTCALLALLLSASASAAPPPPASPAAVQPPAAAPSPAGPPSPLVDGPAESAESVPPSRALVFDTDLHQRADITLAGTHADRHIDLSIPRSWALKADPVLHLALSHSAALLAKRSHLTILLNDHPIGTITLDPGNANDGVANVPLPRSMLGDYNTIRFAAVQHYTDDCEDPFDPTLWTRVSNLSAIYVVYDRKPVTDGLEAWPYPIVDPRAIGPVSLTPVLPSPPSPESTRAAGQVAVTLGRLASYHTLQVAPAVARVEDARTSALIVGTLDEHPEVVALLGPLSLGPTDGVVALVPNPADPALAVLIVSGGGPEGVTRAAQALTGQDRQPVLAGPSTIVHEAVAAAPPANAQNPKPAPRSGVFPLSALGFPGRTVRGYFSESMRIPIRLEGDTYFRPGGGTLTLRYAYSAQLDPALSAVEVRLDGLSLRSLPLDRVEGRQDGELSMRLPEDLLKPDSVLDVVFELYPREFDACKRISDQQIWGTVFASSTLDIPRDHVADMPDLSRLRYDGWPFRADAADGGVIVALPDAPDAESWSAGLEFAGLIGRLSTAPVPDFRLELASATSMSENAPAHFVVLADSSRNTVYDSLVAAKALAVTDAGGARTLSGVGGAVLASGEDTARSDTIEQILQPSNHQRSALVLHEGSRGGLARLVDALGDSGKLSRIEGNLVVVAADGSIRVVDTAKKERWGQVPMATAARLEVRNYWGALGGAMVAAALALVLAVRIWSRSRRGA